MDYIPRIGRSCLVRILLVCILFAQQGITMPISSIHTVHTKESFWNEQALSNTSLASPQMQLRVAGISHAVQHTFAQTLQGTTPAFFVTVRLREHFQSQQLNGSEHDPAAISPEVTVRINQTQKIVFDDIERYTRDFLADMQSQMPPGQEPAIQVVTDYWEKVQEKGLVTLPVPLQQSLIDFFAEHANPMLEPNDLLVYHDEQNGQMGLAPFRICEKRLLNPEINSWAYGVRRIWPVVGNRQEAFNSHLDHHIIYDLDEVDKAVYPLITAHKEYDLAKFAMDKQELEELASWFYTLAVLRMDPDEISDNYIAFLIAHEYAHLLRQLAVPSVDVEYEELLAELFTMATSSPFIAFSRLIYWTHRGLLRGTLFLSTLFNSSEPSDWIRELVTNATTLYDVPAERDTLENNLIEITVSLIHQIEDQLPGGRVLQPEHLRNHFTAKNLNKAA